MGVWTAQCPMKTGDSTKTCPTVTEHTDNWTDVVCWTNIDNRGFQHTTIWLQQLEMIVVALYFYFSKIPQTYFHSSLSLFSHTFSIFIHHVIHSLYHLLLLGISFSLCLITRGFMANCPRFAILAIFNPDFQQQIVQVLKSDHNPLRMKKLYF